MGCNNTLESEVSLMLSLQLSDYTTDLTFPLSMRAGKEPPEPLLPPQPGRQGGPWQGGEGGSFPDTGLGAITSCRKGGAGPLDRMGETHPPSSQSTHTGPKAEQQAAALSLLGLDWPEP